MTLLKRLVRRLKFTGEDDDLSQETDEYVIEVIGIKIYESRAGSIHSRKKDNIQRSFTQNKDYHK